MSEFIQGDCMEYLPKYPDGYFDLAITDPPYGGGSPLMQPTASGTSAADSAACSTATSRTIRGGGRFDAYSKHQVFEDGREVGDEIPDERGFFDHDIRHWDIAPEPAYFKELQRISKNQIIWGGNYFDLPPTRCFIVWRKKNIPAEGFTMAPVEYAWTSFNRNAECFEKSSAGTQSRPRIHPTQKPIELYMWLLDKFAEPGDRILDTHVGSGSSLIACERMGFEYVGFEINRTYYRLASNRLKDETQQLTLLF